MISERVSADFKQTVIHVSKGSTPLALLVARKYGPFDTNRLDFIKAVSSHLAVAFENAFSSQDCHNR